MEIKLCQRNVSYCDRHSKVWKKWRKVERMREGGLNGLPFRLEASSSETTSL